MISPVLLSSARIDWRTPLAFFHRCEERFGKFTLDAAASNDNALCERFYTEKTDGLSQSWAGENAWCNHPYGRKLTRQWQAKAYLESLEPGTRVTLLSPSRTDTRAFHDFLLPTANVVAFVKGRLHFDGAKDPAPFPSVVFHWDGSDSHTIESIDAC